MMKRAIASQRDHITITLRSGFCRFLADVFRAAGVDKLDGFRLCGKIACNQRFGSKRAPPAGSWIDDD